MTKLEMLNVFLTDRLTAAAEEIFRAVKGTIIDYQGEIIRSKEENDRLRRLLNIAVQRVLLQPDHRATHHQHTEDVLSPEQQHCEQEWSPGLGQAPEDPEATQVKEEEQELRTSQEEEQIQRLESDTIIESIFTPPDGKSDCDQEKEPLPAQHYQTHLVNNIERDCLVSTISKEIKTENDGEAAHCTAELTSNIQTSFAVHSDPHAAQSDNHIDTVDINGLKRKGQYSGSEAPQSKGTHHSNVGQSLHKLHSKSGETNSMLPQQELSHQTQGTQRVYCCKDCGKCFSFSCQLEVHMRWHTKERPFNCAVCRKGFTTTSMLRRHYRIHTGEKPFRCHICGKCFNQSAHLNTHFRLHPGEKPSRWKPGPHSKR